MTKKFLFIINILFLISLNIQASKPWEFTNSTPQKLVRTHYYYVEKEHRDLSVAIYTFQNTNLKVSLQKNRVIELYEILKKLKLNIDNISNKRKGNSKNNKYYLFPKEKKIFLVRIDNRWLYSKETIYSIPELYRKYILNIDNKTYIKNKSLSINLNIPDSLKTQLNLTTPYNTILSHLLFTSDSLYNPKLAAQCIDYDKNDTSNRELLAIKLAQIYLGTAKQLFTLSEISNDPNYTDSTTNKHIYYPNSNYKELFLVKSGNKWLYSKTTAGLIESVHDNIYGTDADSIFSFSDNFKNLLGEKRNVKLFNIFLWQFVMLVFFLSIFVAVYVFNIIITKKIISKTFKTKRLSTNIFSLINLISLIIVAKITSSYAPAFEFPIGINHFFLKFFEVLQIFLITATAIYTINIFVVIMTNEDKFDNKFGLLYFMSLIIKLIIFTISLVITIRTLEYDLLSVLTGLSIGGFAIALGAQDTVKNFFGSLMIFADHSFSVGDWINIDNVSGTVEQIGLRSTRIRTFHNSLVTIPNSKISDNNIDNMGKRKYRRYKGTIIIKYNTPPEKIELFIKKIREEIKGNSKIRQDFNMVYINDFGKYGLEILIYVFFIVPDWTEEMKSKHELISKILVLKDDLEIEFVNVPIFDNN